MCIRDRRKGDPWPNIESANVAMRKELDLFANVRPVKMCIRDSGYDNALGSTAADITIEILGDRGIINYED